MTEGDVHPPPSAATSGAAALARNDYRGAVHGFVGLVSSVRESDWSTPALGVWTVQDLVGHTTRAVLTVEAYTDPTRSTEDPALPDSVTYYRAAAAALADPAAVAQRGREAGESLGADPAAAVAAIAGRVLALVKTARPTTRS